MSTTNANDGKAAATAPAYTKKDFESGVDPRWCPGCGDYSIINQVQKLMPAVGVARENIVFISGIGCSSRFPYYMNNYGMHTLHGRAPSFATGLKLSRPELQVWVITGDVLRSYDRVLVPEINLGQLRTIVRAEFLVDALGFNLVRGKPFAIGEIEAKAEQLLGEL